MLSDDSTELWQIRTKRAGCAETTRIENDDLGLLSILDIEWTPTGRTWQRFFVQGPATPTAIGTMDRTGVWSETVDYRDGDIEVSWAQTADGKGYERRDFDDDNGNTVTTGYWERWFSGTVKMEFTAKNRGFKKQTWSFEVDNFGDGVGTWQQDGVSCDLKFSEHSCKQRACSDGSANRACTLPVEWPRF